MDDPALRPAVRAARWAGVAAFATAVAYVAAGPAGGGWAYVAALVVGLSTTGALARRASRAGLPAGAIAATVTTTFFLAFAITLGTALTVALGACLIALGSSK